MRAPPGPIAFVTFRLSQGWQHTINASGQKVMMQTIMRQIETGPMYGSSTWIVCIAICI